MSDPSHDQLDALLAEPFFREAGAGPGVVCLHANASTSTQFRALIELLSSDFHVLAADSYGAGRSPAWPTDRHVSLSDEVALLEPVFARAGAPFALVGHSYGAAVALLAAVARPDRIRALALFEPTLFAVVDAASAPPNDADGIKDTVARAGAALDVGDTDRAAELFIDLWMGQGAWAATPDARKPAIATAVENVRGCRSAGAGTDASGGISNVGPARPLHDGNRLAPVIPGRRAGTHRDAAARAARRVRRSRTHGPRHPSSSHQ